MMINVEDLTEKAARKLLTKIIEELDTLDEEDFFGTEGWKHFLGIED